ncbi:MAG: hypothetical protein H6622_03125 [Halobacteriovoraceae bacterium]|nr:hypothetical protein [Halobacteriovoraceae bacterium]
MIDQKIRSLRNGILILVLIVVIKPSFGENTEEHRGICNDKIAQNYYFKAFNFQQNNETDKALEQYHLCIQKEPHCVSCQYEIGWSYWQKSNWGKVLYHWDIVKQLDSKHELVKQFIPIVNDNLNIVQGKKRSLDLKRNIKLLTKSTPDDSQVQLLYKTRCQSYNKSSANPLDIYTPSIYSPKSVKFSSDDKYVFVNSLESFQTLVFKHDKCELVTKIRHHFDESKERLFVASPWFEFHKPDNVSDKKYFDGKPVEMELSHSGKYLWISYYRRSYDEFAILPSAIGVISTDDFTFKKVFETGPIPKILKKSPDENFMAVSNWGNNTITIFDIKSPDINKFKYHQKLVVDESYSPVTYSKDRDKDCGLCIRGLAFTPDSQYLLVSRMKKTGISVFQRNNINQFELLGTLDGQCYGPRDLLIDSTGDNLYATCNSNGAILKLDIKTSISLLSQQKNVGKDNHIKLTANNSNFIKKVIGQGPRSMKFSNDHKYLFVAVNQTSELIVVEVNNLNIISTIPVDSYPVGLGISNSGDEIWTTSQGRNSKGGNSVGIYYIRYPELEKIRPDIN